MTSLREFHRVAGKNSQTIKVGDVVLIHDNTPRMDWRMAVIEELITGNDRSVRAAKIWTAKGRTNRPITKLVPLEVSSSDSETLRQPPPTESPSSSNTEQNIDGTGQAVAVSGNQGHPQRLAARRGRERVTEWTSRLRTLCPPEDVMDSMN